MKNNTSSNSKEFFSAVEEGNIKKVASLLGAGIEPNSKDKYDNTALHYASKKGHSEIVKLLLEKGANVNAQDNDIGYTVLHRASMAGHLEVAKLLLDKGANINAQDIFSETALHLATVSGHLEVVKLLFEKGGRCQCSMCDRFVWK